MEEERSQESTHRRMVLTLCLPWNLSDFSLIWFLVEAVGASWWAWGLWTLIVCSSCFRPGYKIVSKGAELDRWLLEPKAQQLMLEPTCQSFTRCPWIAVHRNPYKCQVFLVHKHKQSFRHHSNGPWTFAVKHKTVHRLQQLNPDFYVQIRQENKSKHLCAAAVERVPP